MEQNEIEKGNRLIAAFMGLVVIKAGTIPIGKIKHPEISEAFLKYHTSWDWLVPVCKKCSDICYEQRPSNLDLNGKELQIRHMIANWFDIDRTYAAVIQFITYHNNLKALNTIEDEK